MIIASFPKGSFPANSCPVGTWPVAPAVVDIQYTEVMEFAACIAASAEFEVVLPNDDVVVISYPDMIVSGAGMSAANGTWVYSGMYNGKPQYTFNDQYLAWSGTLWLIQSYYYSADDVATPDLVTTWIDGGYGAASLPTVTAKPNSILTEIVNFTVEMPMIIDFEPYEELSA